MEREDKLVKLLTLVLELNECDEFIHILGTSQVTWARLANITRAGWEVHFMVSLHKSLWSSGRDAWTAEPSDSPFSFFFVYSVGSKALTTPGHNLCL